MNNEEIYNAFYNGLRSFIEDKFRSIIPQCDMGKYTELIIEENQTAIHRLSENCAYDISERFIQILNDYYMFETE